MQMAIITSANGSLANRKGKGTCIRLKKAMSTQVTGMKMQWMAGERRSGQMVRSTKGSSKWMSETGSEDGSQEKITDMKDSLKRE